MPATFVSKYSEYRMQNDGNQHRNQIGEISNFDRYLEDRRTPDKSAQKTSHLIESAGGLRTRPATSMAYSNSQIGM